MSHWKSMMDRNFIGWFDLHQGRDTVVVIDRVVAGELNNMGKKSKKPIAYFKGGEKGLALNSTNCKTLERLSGSPDTEKWAGMRIALYVGTTRDPSGQEEQVNCVRVRPKLPTDAKQQQAQEKAQEGAAQ